MSVKCIMSSDHRVLIDWLSFTIEVPIIGTSKGNLIWQFTNQEMTIALGDLWVAMNAATGSWELSSGRAPYSASYRSPIGISLFYNVRIGHMLMEVSGRGCEWLASRGFLELLIIRMKNRFTRIDLAVDLLTSTSPSDFTKVSQSARFKSRGTITSDTGQTEYIGSQKSERYCRVYRYAPPHPRAAMLRAEMVFKKQNAKIFAQTMIDSHFNYDALALGSGAIYGFEHPDWDLGGDEISVASWTPEREKGKTVRWLCSQVAPAFKKLVEDGIIDDPEAFLREWFL